MNIATSREHYLENLATLPPQGIKLSKKMDIARLFPDFERNPHAEEAERICKEWAQSLGIWLAKGDEYNSMGAFLHPNCSLERLVAINKVYVLLYFIDDKMAGDTQRLLKGEEAQVLNPLVVISKCIHVMETGQTLNGASKLEEAILHIMHLFAELADPRWIPGFVHAMEHHLKQGVKNHDSTATGEVLSRERYVEIRRAVSGMDPAIKMMEVALDTRINDDLLKELGILKEIEDLRRGCALVGALSNDIISYEKEASLGTDFNLISNTMLNNPDISFLEAIFESIHVVNAETRHFLNTAEKLHHELLRMNLPDEFRHQLHLYVQALIDAIAASWHWQQFTDRYSSKTSPFSELRKRKSS